MVALVLLLAHTTVDFVPTEVLTSLPTATMPCLDPLPLVLAPAYTTVDAVPAAVITSIPTATATWLAPLPSIVALVLPLAHTTVNLVPTMTVTWLDPLPFVFVPAQAVDAVLPGVLASMPPATIVAEPKPPPPAPQTELRRP